MPQHACVAQHCRYVFFDGTFSPVLWNVDRISFRIIDFCVGKAEAPRMLALIVIAEDGMVYRSSVHLTSGRIEVTPNRVRCINQAHRVYCGPHAEHLFGLSYPRRLRPVDITFGDVPCVNDFTVEECSDIAQGDEAIIIHGDARRKIDSKWLSVSPYLGTCYLPRWRDLLSGPEKNIVRLPYQSPDWFDDNGKVRYCTLRCTHAVCMHLCVCVVGVD